MSDSPSATWSRLARKYGALVTLRARRDSGGEPATRGELRKLAGEFPGCLRELDTLAPDELARRAKAASAAAAGAATEPWMHWIAAYHAAMTEALAARAAGRRAGPEGRLNVIVLRRLALHFGVPAETIASGLFPLRRPSPYRL